MNTSKYKYLFVNIGLFAVNAITTKLLSFILMPVYTIYLATKDYGIMDMSIVVINFIFPLATVMINGGVLRFGIEDQKHIKFYATDGLLITLASCAVVGALLPLLKLSFFGSLGSYALLFFISYFTSCFPNYFGILCRVVNEIKVIPVASLITAFSMLLTTYYFIVYKRMGIIGYFYSYIISNIISTVTYLLGAKLYKYFSLKSVYQNRHLQGPLLKYSIPLAPNAVCDVLGLTFSRFILTSSLGINASGLYAAASKVPNLMSIFQQVFNQAWQISSFQEYKKKGINSFYSIIWKGYCAVLFLGCSIVISFTNTLSDILLHNEFYSAKKYIPILCFGFLFGAASGFFGSIYQTFLKTRPLLIQSLVGAGITVICTWLLVPYIGIAGAVIAVALGNSVMLIIRIIDSRRLIPFNLALPTCLTSLGLILIQAVIVTMNTPTTNWISVACLLMILLLQSLNLYPFIKIIIKHKKA
ncbi:lipopolysaccharide biosynthesis protein [Bifidobacterium pseudolongum]|uniref:Membrane spanning polysaccharide biosynthesis protein n=1 Tax=Bifidobacterium pseudolongum TaxID=1694 RepID=A0A395XDE4_9BIFI|nr:polysaccharide biosynthesis C-terminal domain-containing protein [Bifidobacterium pseudolongum]RGW09347.1 membrane spanning polysaccharide biosynthesis protein [Bifidobacterium pseudolongum]